MANGKILPKSGKFFASATEHTQSWNRIQKEITGRVQRKLAYEVTVLVRIFGNNVTISDVRATLYVQKPDLREQYIGIAKLVYVVVGFPNCCIWIFKFYYQSKLLLLFNTETTLIWYCYHFVMVLRPLKYGVTTIQTLISSKHQYDITTTQIWW